MPASQLPSFPFVTKIPSNPTTPPGTHPPSSNDEKPLRRGQGTFRRPPPVITDLNKLFHSRLFELPLDSVTVYDVLKYIGLPDAPRIYKDGMLAGTRGPSKHNLRLQKNLHLEQVVYVPSLISQLYPEAKRMLDALPVTDSIEDSILAHLMGSTRYMEQDDLLPWTIRSEHDTEDWVLSILLRPAVAAAVCAAAGTLVHKVKPIGPNICAGNGSDNIPDCVVFNSDGEIVSTVEIKTHGALTEETFRDVEKLAPGRAARFIWPTEDNMQMNQLDTGTKILIQIWAQMTEHKVDLAMLSSYQCSYFFYKKDQTLYMSEAYKCTKTNPRWTLLATFVYIALALGLIDHKKLKVPKVDKSHWPKLKDLSDGRQALGFDLETLPKPPRNNPRSMRSTRSAN